MGVQNIHEGYFMVVLNRSRGTFEFGADVVGQSQFRKF